MRVRIHPILVAGVAAGFLLAGCGNKVVEVGFTETPADQLYNEGLVLMNGGDFRTAMLKFEEVDRLYPQSDLGRKSQVMIAYAQYSRGQYVDAAISAKRFITLYPRHPDAAYAQYIMASSYYRQIPDVTRDQEGTKIALQAFEELIEKYPTSEYVDEAQRRLQAARDQLAGKEMEVGRYYLERDDNLAAINRFRVVVEQYQTTRHIEEALYRLCESYYTLGLTQEAQAAAAVLGHNFPDSKWYKDAYSLLQNGGLAPQASGTSWITKAFKTVVPI